MKKMDVFKAGHFCCQLTEHPHKLQLVMEARTVELWGKRAVTAKVVTTTTSY